MIDTRLFRENGVLFSITLADDLSPESLFATPLNVFLTGEMTSC